MERAMGDGKQPPTGGESARGTSEREIAFGRLHLPIPEAAPAGGEASWPGAGPRPRRLGPNRAQSRARAMAGPGGLRRGRDPSLSRDGGSPGRRIRGSGSARSTTGRSSPISMPPRTGSRARRSVAAVGSASSASAWAGPSACSPPAIRGVSPPRRRSTDFSPTTGACSSGPTDATGIASRARRSSRRPVCGCRCSRRSPARTASSPSPTSTCSKRALARSGQFYRVDRYAGAGHAFLNCDPSGRLSPRVGGAGARPRRGFPPRSSPDER